VGRDPGRVADEVMARPAWLVRSQVTVTLEALLSGAQHTFATEHLDA
jgi:hypothetical protein